MKTIILKPFNHKGAQQIGLYFENDTHLNTVVKKLDGARWSKTHTCWYIPLQKECCNKAIAELRKFAQIQTEDLRNYLLKNKDTQNKKIPAPDNSTLQNISDTIPVSRLSEENMQILIKYTEHLKLKAYSASTIRTYKNEFIQLLKLLNKKPVHTLTTDELRRYFLYCIEKLNLSENSLHSRINAIKYYFEQILGNEKMFIEIPRPKKQHLLPKLLNETELARLFNSLSNKKHKAMLFTAYSAGLRVSEIVKITLADIDSKRMQIFIKQAKGKKDRYVTLSPVLLDILRNYIKTYTPQPKKYLFESEQTGTAYPTRTVQQIFSNAKNKAGIKKDVGIHSLRHSFATHLLDKGTDIRYIKDLLGHYDIKTTERYLHVSKNQLVNIICPLDDLWRKEKIDW